MRPDEHEALNSALIALRYELAYLRFALLERKYRADQPRVPAGDPAGGEWTSESGYFTNAARRIIRRTPVDLRAEEAAGGHAIEKHVGLSSGDLMRKLSGERLDTLGATAFWQAEGSFNDLQSANGYVNDVLDNNPNLVDAVASGQKDAAFIQKRYDSPTGREAYRVVGDPEGIVRTRDTFWVGVYITHSNRPNGFTVRTAYPMNRDSSS